MGRGAGAPLRSISSSLCLAQPGSFRPGGTIPPACVQHSPMDGTSGIWIRAGRVVTFLLN